jgi:hypothetical protein
MKVIGSISKKTGLQQETWRLSGRHYTGRITEARGRKLAAGFLPGDVIAIRPHGLGKKRTEFLNIADAYEIAYNARLRDQAAQKKSRKSRR